MEKSDFIVWASKLQSSYQPSEEVLKDISDVTLVAIVGPTGVGKTTLIERMNIPNVLSDVSRDPRPEEKDGKDYYFRTDYLQVISDIKQGQYTQFLISNNGEFYGTLNSSYPESGLCTMAVLASAIPTFRKIGFKKVIPIYIMPPSYVEWMRRIGGVRAKDLLARIGEARHSILTALEDGEYFGFPVGAGLGCFVDESTNDLYLKMIDQFYSENPDKNYYDDLLAKEFEEYSSKSEFSSEIGDWNNHIIDNQKKLNIIMFSSGWGDGYYPTYWGYDEIGSTIELTIDFLFSFDEE